MIDYKNIPEGKVKKGLWSQNLQFWIKSGLKLLLLSTNIERYSVSCKQDFAEDFVKVKKNCIFWIPLFILIVITTVIVQIT